MEAGGIVAAGAVVAEEPPVFGTTCVAPDIPEGLMAPHALAIIASVLNTARAVSLDLMFSLLSMLLLPGIPRLSGITPPCTCLDCI